jgi:hypothetical protein
MGTPTSDKPIIRLTGFAGGGSNCKNRLGETARQVVFGVDGDGNERVYAILRTEEEQRAWTASDPLWREMQGQAIGTLFKNPATRDLVLRINIQAALEQGDTETAAKLAQALSPEALDELLKSAEETEL